MSMTDGSASQLNRELTGLLREAGLHYGFGVTLEYAVPGGRLDVVWTWSPDTPFPGLTEPVPVVGFEIESSWRTRKHVKGDLLNLHDAGVGLGVIVLAGTEAKDAGLRRFAELLVDRPGPKVLVWTADDVRALAEGREVALAVSVAEGMPNDLPSDASSSRGSTSRSQVSAATHTGKYVELYRWLRAQDVDTLTVRFSEVEAATGTPLPDSCRKHAPHWHSYEGSAVARAIIDAGWKATQVNLSLGTVTFVRDA